MPATAQWWRVLSKMETNRQAARETPTAAMVFDPALSDVKLDPIRFTLIIRNVHRTVYNMHQANVIEEIESKEASS